MAMSDIIVLGIMFVVIIPVLFMVLKIAYSSTTAMTNLIEEEHDMEEKLIQDLQTLRETSKEEIQILKASINKPRNFNFEDKRVVDL